MKSTCMHVNGLNQKDVSFSGVMRGLGREGWLGGGGGVIAATTQIKEHKSFPEQFE